MLISAAAMPASAVSVIPDSVAFIPEGTNIYEIIKGKDLDFNNDGSIDRADYAIYFSYMIDVYEQDTISDFYNKLIEKGDLNNDGKIDGTDMLYVLSAVNGELEECLPGDVNLDGIINGTDATLALNCYTGLLAGTDKNDIPYHDLVKGYGDMNGDSVINGSDATMILNMYTELSTGK